MTEKDTKPTALHPPEIQSSGIELAPGALEKLKACIHCGFCLPVCPTYRVTGSEAESPRGRLYLMKQMMSGELAEPVQLMPHLDQCLGCQACQTACPSGVQYGELLFESRKALTPLQPQGKRHFKRFVFEKILPNSGLLATMSRLFRLYQQSGLQALVRKSGVLKLFPALAHQEALLPTVRKSSPLLPGMSFGNLNGSRVALLTGCVMDAVYNPIHWATVEVLVANGYYVFIPDQTCCGALAYHAGETDIARLLAKENVDKILSRNPDWVVVNSAGCGATLKEYAHVLNETTVYRQKAEVFAKKVVDVMELLAKKPLAPMPHPVEKRVTYHAACHLHHVQGVKQEPFTVLEQVPGMELVPLEAFDACCGSAGIYNLEQPELSEDILAMKMAHIKATGAEVVVTGNPGCLLQIEHGMRQDGLEMTVLHPVELLAQAYGKSSDKGYQK